MIMVEWGLEPALGLLTSLPHSPVFLRPRSCLQVLWHILRQPRHVRGLNESILTVINKECFQLQVTENHINGNSTVRTLVLTQ